MESLDLRVLPDVLAFMHGPVSLRLGAKTPAEIAVPSAAEIVQVKNKGLSDAMLLVSAEAEVIDA